MPSTYLFVATHSLLGSDCLAETQNVIKYRQVSRALTPARPLAVYMSDLACAESESTSYIDMVLFTAADRAVINNTAFCCCWAYIG